MSRKIVVIGGDAAGMSAASRAKRRDPELSIQAFEMGDYVSYGACGIPYAVSGEVPEVEDLVVVTPEKFRDKRGIGVSLRHRVERIDRAGKKVVVRDLENDRMIEAEYDQLVLTTGARPIVPPGIDTSLEEVFLVRNLMDAARLKNFIAEKKPKEALIVGAGYIGLEMAESLTTAGLRVSLAVRGGRAMSSAEEEISEAIAQELRLQGVDLLTGSAPEGLERTDSGRVRAALAGGRSLETDIVVVGAGVRPASALAREAGLDLGARDAVRVDRRLRTSDPDIFSGGDCAEAYHLILEANTYVPLALGANRQGRIIGDNLAGVPAEFPGILGTSVCKVFDLTVARTGLSSKEAKEAGFLPLSVSSKAPSKAHYYPGGGPILTVLIVDRATGRPLGAQMVGIDGVAKRIDTWAAALTAGMSLQEIADMDLAYAPPFSPVWDPVLIAASVALKKVK